MTENHAQTLANFRRARALLWDCAAHAHDLPARPTAADLLSISADLREIAHALQEAAGVPPEAWPRVTVRAEKGTVRRARRT